MKKLNDKIAKDERLSIELVGPRSLAENKDKIKIPEPAQKHVYCGICNMNYENYIKHIESIDHLYAVQNESLFEEIDNLIQEFDTKYQLSEQAKQQNEKWLEEQEESLTNRKIIRMKSQFSQGAGLSETLPISQQPTQVYNQKKNNITQPSQLTNTTASQTAKFSIRPFSNANPLEQIFI